MLSARSTFPWRRLVLPGLVPVAIVGLAVLSQALGYQWNIHGDAIPVFLALVATSFGAAAISAITLPGAIRRLKTVTSERTFPNLASVAFAIAYLLAFTAIVARIAVGL